MSEEAEEVTNDIDSELSDESVAKPRFKLKMPSPLVFYFIGPFVIIFIVYIVLTKLLLSSDLPHEAKLEQVLKIELDQLASEDVQLEAGEETDKEEDDGGFLDTHNYFQFPMAFAVNIADTNKNLTFELAVSSFQSGVTAEWFFESFTAFVPALRSDILYFMGEHSLQELQSPDYQTELLITLKDVINSKLESLGAKPEISKVLFLRFVIT